jgi:hypothetical protein
MTVVINSGERSIDAVSPTTADGAAIADKDGEGSSLRMRLSDMPVWRSKYRGHRVRLENYKATSSDIRPRGVRGREYKDTTNKACADEKRCCTFSSEDIAVKVGRD